VTCSHGEQSATISHHLFVYLNKFLKPKKDAILNNCLTSKIPRKQFYKFKTLGPIIMIKTKLSIIEFKKINFLKIQQFFKRNNGVITSELQWVVGQTTVALSLRRIPARRLGSNLSKATRVTVLLAHPGPGKITFARFLCRMSVARWGRAK
jgi:hypothetical protein